MTSPSSYMLRQHGHRQLFLATSVLSVQFLLCSIILFTGITSQITDFYCYCWQYCSSTLPQNVAYLFGSSSVGCRTNAQKNKTATELKKKKKVFLTSDKHWKVKVKQETADSLHSWDFFRPSVKKHSHRHQSAAHWFTFPMQPNQNCSKVTFTQIPSEMNMPCWCLVVLVSG